MRNTTPQYRAAVARGWRASGLSQAEYSSQQGISPRTLREWLQRHAPPDPQREVQRVIQMAMEALQDLLAGVEQHQEAPGAVQAVVQPAAPAGPEAGRPVQESTWALELQQDIRAICAEAEDAAQAGPSQPPTAASILDAKNVKPPKRRRPSYFSDFT